MVRRVEKLGSPRTDRRLINDVCLSAVPRLERGFVAEDASTRSILGDAPKVLIRLEGTAEMEHAYIAKGPRKEGPRECVTEHLIGEIGRLLPIRVARSRLVRVPRRCGPVPGALDPSSRNYCPDDLRFMSRFFVRTGESLVHGVELVAHCFEVDEQQLLTEVKGRKDERQFYTVALVDNVLEQVAPNHYHQLRDGFARMMAFDALIGANDRHPQNWGVLMSAVNRDQPPRFAPIFDTARGLLWNHPDERLREQDERGRRREFIERYAQNSTPLIGVEGFENPSHFDVIDYMVRYSQRGFAPEVRRVLASFNPEQVRLAVRRAAGGYFSKLRLGYIVDLLRYRHSVLSDICGL